MRQAIIILSAVIWGLLPVVPILSAPLHSRIIARRNVAAGGGTSPSTTNLVAWYDFADNTDADGGTYNLTETNAPSYAAGPPSTGTATDGSPGAFWSSTTLDDNFGNTDQDWSFVIRWQAYSSIASNDYIFSSNGSSKVAIRWVTANITGFLCHATSGKTGAAPSLGTWYTTVLVHDADANGGVGATYISVNNSALSGGNVTGSYTAGTTYLGGSSATVTNNVIFDFAGFYGRELTQDEVTWLYNSGGTRTYSDL